MPSTYFRRARRHPVVVVVLALLAAAILATSLAKGRGRQAVVYFAALALSAVAIDAVLAWRPVLETQIQVRHPGAELAVASLSFLMALAWLLNHFEGSYQIRTPLLRLAAVSVIFNVPLALVLLGLRSDLGLRLRGFAPVPVVFLCFAVLAAAFTPASITLKEGVQEAGSIGGFLLGSLGEAALPEEFFRWVWQTRVAACFNNRAAAWLIASVLWATLHAPVEYAQSHSLAAVATYIMGIVPIGLLWGYLTMRTQSILPSVLLHCVNLWGLQNL